MENEERERERLPVREQLSRANRATCRHVNWLASLISILFGNLSRVKLRRATIDDNTGLRYTFPPPPPPPSLRLLTRHEFNSRGRSSYESVRSCGKIALFRFFFSHDRSFASIINDRYSRSSFFFFFTFRKSPINLFPIRSPLPHAKEKIIDDPPFRDISFQIPSSPVVGGSLVPCPPTSILKIARIIRRIPRSNVIIVINPFLTNKLQGKNVL